MSTLILLDGMALIYRAHFALMSRPIMNSAGMNTSAVFGYTNTLLQLLEARGPTHMALALDTSEPTERHTLYPDYKAQREDVPEDILNSVPYVEAMTRALGIKVLKQPGYEADDIIGTLAGQASEAGLEVLMVTPDKDFAQLVAPKIRQLKPARKGTDLEEIGVEEVCEKWNVKHPSSVADILGLWGDASDNIPGVPGVGEKTAKKLMGEYETVDALLAHTADIKGKLREKIEEHAEQARLSKNLATINRSVPLKESVEDLKIGDRDEQALAELCVELEFKTLEKRLLGDAFEAGRGHGAGQQEIDLEGSTLDHYDANRQNYQQVTSLDELRSVCEACNEAGQFCFDTETDGLDALECRLIGVAMSMKPNTGWYAPVPEGREERDDWDAVLRDLLETSTASKVGHNLKFDLLVLRRHGISVRGPFFDTLIAHALVDPDQRHRMDDLARQYFGYEPISITSLIGEKKSDQLSMLEVPLEQVAVYASEDADITARLAETLQPKLEASGMLEIFRDIEMPLVDTLTSMEYEGIGLDQDALSRLQKELQTQIQHLEANIHEAAGHPFNLNSPKQLGVVLFEELKIVEKPKKTNTGQYATNEQVLSTLAGSHEIIDWVLEYRELTKLQSTYVEALPQSINDRTGRIHTSFSQIAAATGRLASSNPNLQNIPIRTALGRRIREAFVPHHPEDLIFAADYSQIELRIMADLSEDPALVEAFENQLDIHSSTASRVYSVDLDAVTPDMRRKAKMVNFGIMYGISAFGLSQRLRIPRKEAQEIIEAYFEQYPKVKAFMQQSIASAREHGWSETRSGRRRVIRDINSSNQTTRNAAERMAINTPVQGTAADMIKIAMNRIHAEIQERSLQSRMLLQVHDELVFTQAAGEGDALQELVVQAMQQAMPLNVPVQVDTGTGANWLEAH